MNYETPHDLHVDSIVKQGFICPLCMAEFVGSLDLHEHVKNVHPSPTLTAETIHHIKGFIDKAKKKIMNLDVSMSSFDLPMLERIELYNSMDEKQALASTDDCYKDGIVEANNFASTINPDFGISYSHTEYLIRCRAPCINDTTVKTNNLIVRLDKLLSKYTEVGSNERRIVEQAAVPWTADRHASKCMNCSQKFTLTKRRHHCRLCGCIICHSCSKFLNLLAAHKFTDPAYATELLDQVSHEPVHNTHKHKNMNTSAEIRICGECRDLLNQRSKKIDELNSPPVIFTLYEQIRTLLQEASELAVIYLRMIESLRRGESLYTLDSAVQLRSKLMKLRQKIDSDSLALERLGVGNCTATEFSTKGTILRKNIRSAVVKQLQELTLYLVGVPGEDLYNDREATRNAVVDREDDFNSEHTDFSILQRSHTSRVGVLHASSPAEQRSIDVVSSDGGSKGWLPSSLHFINPFLDDDDAVNINPITEQIFIIRSYLKQAAEDGRVDEIKILENNLRQLEEELRCLDV